MRKSICIIKVLLIISWNIVVLLIPRTSRGQRIFLGILCVKGNVLKCLVIAMNTVYCVMMVNRESTKLKFEFYQKHILAISESGSRDWWKNMKKIMGLNRTLIQIWNS